MLAVLGVIVVAVASVTLVTRLRGPAYANDDYQAPPPALKPPPLPEVTSAEQARELVRNNALYAQPVPHPTRCPIQTIDLTTASRQQLDRYLNELMVCLMRVWEPPVTKAGYQMPRPPVVVISEPSKSACGKVSMKNAAYCGADQRIYYATDLPTVLPPALRTGRFVVESVLAHELGHAVQARTGLLVAGKGLGQQASDKATQNQFSRRLETQADCFSGLFIASVSTSAKISAAEQQQLLALAEAIGDDTLSGKAEIDSGHGLSKSRRYWTQMGLASTRVGACNTWVADDHLVR